jgi:prepilin-type N-terminal cleavage/methylation domain-containing protein
MRSNQIPNRAARNARSAFTLIEMMMVITLVSIATAMAMPRINYTAYRVDMGARGLRVAMQRAQAFAVSSQHNELVAVDVTGGVVYVVDDVNNNLAADPGERITTVPLQDGVVFAEPTSTWVGAPTPSGAVTGPALTTITINGLSMPGFVFRCDGASSTDVQIYLSSTRGLETDARGVSVTQATGRSDWYKDVGNATWIAGGF